MSLIGENNFSVWQTGVFTNGWSPIRLELTSTNLTWFPLKKSFFSFSKEQTEEPLGKIVLNQIQSAFLATTADVEAPMGDDLEGLHVIKIRTTSRNYEPCLYSFGIPQQKKAKEWLVHIQERMTQKNHSNLFRRGTTFETLEIEMTRWNFGFFSDGWAENRLELTATGLEWYKMFFDVSNCPVGHIDYQDIHSMFTYIPSPVITVPSEFSTHLPSNEDLEGKHIFCVLFTDSHTPTNRSNKCGMYIFCFETEDDRDLIGEKIWNRRKAILGNKASPSPVLPLNPKPPLPTLSSTPISSSSSSSSPPSPPPSPTIEPEPEPYTLFSDEMPEESSPPSSPLTPPDSLTSSLTSFFPKMEVGFVPSASQVHIDPPPLPSLSEISENLKNSFTRSASPPPSNSSNSSGSPSILSSLSTSTNTLSSFWREKGEGQKEMKKVSSAPAIAKDEEGLFPSALANLTDRFSSGVSSPGSSTEEGELNLSFNGSFLSNVASSLGILESDFGSERRSERKSERSERKSGQEEKNERGSANPNERDVTEPDDFAEKEFDNLSKELENALEKEESEEITPNYYEINTGEEDDDDDDFFAEDDTQDYVLPSPKNREAKKAKGIEIRWSEVDL